MTTQSTYLAGSATAKADRKRGMSLDAMALVPQSDDNRNWANGYRDRLASYVAVKCVSQEFPTKQ